MKHCDMLHGLAFNLVSLIRCTVPCDTLVRFICPTAKPQCEILMKALICSKQSVTTYSAMSCSKTLAVHCHSDVCSVAGVLTARCRTSRVCLQHYAMWWHLIVLQYVTVSFHLPWVGIVKYQQSQLLWYPRCCFLSPTSRQPLFVATAVYCVMAVQICQQI